MSVTVIAKEHGYNVKKYVGLSTDTKPTDCGIGSIFIESDTNNKYMYNGTVWKEHDIKFKDLGLVIDVTNMAAGATVYSNWVDNVQWVRNVVYLSQSDQQYDLRSYRRDSSLTIGWGNNVQINKVATGSSNWDEYMTNSTSALLGYSSRFAIKNSSASPNTYARLRVQLMGL